MPQAISLRPLIGCRTIQFPANSVERRAPTEYMQTFPLYKGVGEVAVA